MASFYSLNKITSLDNITSKEHKILSLTVNQATYSDFNSSLRLGACLFIKGQYILCGKST